MAIGAWEREAELDRMLAHWNMPAITEVKWLICYNPNAGCSVAREEGRRMRAS